MEIINLMSAIHKRPRAFAKIRGSKEYPALKGRAYFYATPSGVLIVTSVSGLPDTQNKCSTPVFAYHIHSGENCSGDEKDPFAGALTHFNPASCPHPYHAGDMPPLFYCKGGAFSAFLTDRFTVREIIGKTVIIHSNPDDFTTNPSGNSGVKIACGKIIATR